jgi:hypothetical protein
MFLHFALLLFLAYLVAVQASSLREDGTFKECLLKESVNFSSQNPFQVEICQALRGFVSKCMKGRSTHTSKTSLNSELKSDEAWESVNLGDSVPDANLVTDVNLELEMNSVTDTISLLDKSRPVSISLITDPVNRGLELDSDSVVDTNTVLNTDSRLNSDSELNSNSVPDSAWFGPITKRRGDINDRYRRLDLDSVLDLDSENDTNSVVYTSSELDSHSFEVKLELLDSAYTSSDSHSFEVKLELLDSVAWETISIIFGSEARQLCDPLSTVPTKMRVEKRSVGCDRNTFDKVERKFKACRSAYNESVKSKMRKVSRDVAKTRLLLDKLCEDFRTEAQKCLDITMSCNNKEDKATVIERIMKETIAIAPGLGLQRIEQCFYRNGSSLSFRLVLFFVSLFIFVVAFSSLYFYCMY